MRRRDHADLEALRARTRELVRRSREARRSAEEARLQVLAAAEAVRRPLAAARTEEREAVLHELGAAAASLEKALSEVMHERERLTERIARDARPKAHKPGAVVIPFHR